jgi:hypothetical protein
VQQLQETVKKKENNRRVKLKDVQREGKRERNEEMGKGEERIEW